MHPSIQVSSLILSQTQEIMFIWHMRSLVIHFIVHTLVAVPRCLIVHVFS